MATRTSVIALLLAISVSLCGTASASPASSWNSTSDTVKYSYIGGFAAGLNYAVVLWSKSGKSMAEINAQPTLTGTAEISQYCQKNAETVLREIDFLYSDPRNANIPWWGGVMYCLFLAVDHKTEAEMESWLRSMRIKYDR